MRRAVALTLALTAATAPAAAIDWPVARPAARAADPIAALRWEALPMWVAPSPMVPRAVLAALDAAPEESPRFHALRAVALRLLARERDALDALGRARALGDGSLDDADAALTAAWLDARRGLFDRACADGVDALARRAGSHAQEALALEVTRWCLARGPAGLTDAAATLDALARSGAWSPRGAALRALVFARAGALDEARAVTAPMRVAVTPTLAEPIGAERDGAAPGETLNAVGVALALNGDSAAARAVLTRALERTPDPWRAFHERFLASLPEAPR